MMAKDDIDTGETDECITPQHPIPAEKLARYSVERDLHSEQDITNYVEGQARDEIVQHAERVKQEVVLGDTYEIWDVTTDKDRWWVITNLTNLYSQKHFPSLDYTLSFHIGLMMRLRSLRLEQSPQPSSTLVGVDSLKRAAQQHVRRSLSCRRFATIS